MARATVHAVDELKKGNLWRDTKRFQYFQTGKH